MSPFDSSALRQNSGPLRSSQVQDRLIVGLTGGIGSGKSTVAQLFAKHGAGIVDTDVIAHRLTQAGGEANMAIRTAFGERYFGSDGALDRAMMRKLVFADAIARKKLEGILHPLIRDQAKAGMQQLREAPYIILIVPLLPESPAFRQLAQRVLVVDCDEAAQIARVVSRSAMEEAEVRAIIASQTPRAERLRLADDVIHNEAGLESLATEVAELNERYRQSTIAHKGYSIYR